jgi:hypothetical protein
MSLMFSLLFIGFVSIIHLMYVILSQQYPVSDHCQCSLWLKSQRRSRTAADYDFPPHRVRDMIHLRFLNLLTSL